MRRGSQEPTFTIAPVPGDGFESLDGEDAVRFAARFGLVLDPWQTELCTLWMRRGVDGKWCAGTWGISVPRQNGKNAALEAVELYGMVVLRQRFLHTAHEMKTAQKAFRRLKHFFGEKRDDPHARFPELNQLVAEVRNTKTQEAIILRHPDTGEDLGSVEFVARSSGSGRGFTNDVLVLDEAQHLTDEQLEASRPAISAGPSGDPVAIYMGTPPKPSALADEGAGAAFIRIRNGARTGEAERAAWMEFGIEVNLESMTDLQVRELALDMPAAAKTNPALGRRLFEQTLVDELAEMGPRSYCRERLNVWPEPRKSGEGAVSLDLWRSRILKPAHVSSDWRLAAVGLDMDLSGRVWVSVAAHADDPGVHVELLPDDPLADGADGAVKWLWQRCRKLRPVVMSADSGATVLEAALLAKGMKVYRLNLPEQAQASSGLVQALKDREVSHLDDSVLEQDVRESQRVEMKPGQWRLGRKGELSGAPLWSAACARFGAVKWSKRLVVDPDRVPGRGAGRRLSDSRR